MPTQMPDVNENDTVRWDGQLYSITDKTDDHVVVGGLREMSLSEFADWVANDAIRFEVVDDA